MRRFILNLWLGCLPICCLSQVENKAFTLVRMIERNHMQPKQVDDTFSEAVFKGIIEELDPYKIYFKASDIKILQGFEQLIDDDIKNRKSVFLTSLQTTYQSALNQNDEYALQLLEKPFDFSKADFFIESSKAALPVDDAAWKKRFTQYLKWRILVRMQEQWEGETTFKEDSTATPLPVNDTGFFNKNEAIFRAGIAKNVKKRMAKRAEDLSTFKSYLEKVYLDQIAQTFDPHTNYFDDKAKDEFTESLSSQSFDFGFELEEDEDGDLIISGLVPGGAAWNTGNIYKDDKLMQIKMADGKVVQAKDLSPAQLQTLLNGEGKGQVELQLKSTDGKSKKVKLQKEEVTNEENIVRGFVLEGDKKIGYIALPGFYTEWDDNQSSSCANDIAKEIVKLKREKIDGLLFDLRYNGGGSLQEAIEIAGIFIDAGPMAIIRDQTKKAITLKDPSRGQIYDGPLMVMINGQSASASELVAATLQDYQRATIVGSPSFGKATMQVVLPLDTMFNPEKPLQSKQVKKQTDYIKVTTGALYRITGGTNQFNGVIPDILLPDVFETMGYAEKTLPNALRPDTITKVVAFTPLPQKDLGLAKDFSTKELMKTTFFAATLNWVTDQKKQADTGSVPLTWEAYLVWDKAQYPPDEEAEEYMGNKSPFTPKNASFTQQMLSYESDYKQELNKEVLSLIASDLYIHAAYQLFLKSVL